MIKAKGFGMRDESVVEHVLKKAIILREDIVRAKNWILAKETYPDSMPSIVDAWLTSNSAVIPSKLDMMDPQLIDALDRAALAYSLRLAFYQAVWELTGANELLAGQTEVWESHALDCVSPGRGYGVNVNLKCPYPVYIYRMPLTGELSTDSDVFLAGVNCATLHAGILQGVQQSLVCFRRGLYMPSIAMLAAAIEACWIECGTAVAKRLSSTKIDAAIVNGGIGKIVADQFGASAAQR